MIREFLRRKLHNPRWQFLKPLVGPYVLSANPQEQWLRIVLNEETKKIIDSLNPEALSALEISGDNWNAPGLFREYRMEDYPKYDLCAGPLPERFDLIIAEQVFEHLLWPYRAGRHVHEMLKPGGWFFISTPFLIRIHGHPIDCSRWTELGLKHLLAECGFPIDEIQTGSWGNRACIKGNLDRWQIFQKWRHSLNNEPDFPVVVWALAKKKTH